MIKISLYLVQSLRFYEDTTKKQKVKQKMIKMKKSMTARTIHGIAAGHNINEE